MEYHDSGLYVYDDQPEPEIQEPIATIDPLFITYACNDRQSPDYDVAVRQWGYLTHGGKDLICREYLDGNHSFVLHHQQLVVDSIDDLLGQYVGHDGHSGFRQIHEQDPEAWYRIAVQSVGSNARSPFRRWRVENMSYLVFDLLYQAKTADTDPLTIAGLHNFIQRWAESDATWPEEYSNVGEALAPTLTRTRSTHLSRRLQIVRDNELQYLLIGAIIEASPRFGRGRQGMVLEHYERVYLRYQQEFPDLWFDQWLVENADSFLALFWPSQDWTPQHQRP